MFGLLKMHFNYLDRPGGTSQYSPQKVGAFFVACCLLHNIAMCHGCVLDINEDTLQVFRKHDAELHVRMPMNQICRQQHGQREISWQEICIICNLVSKLNGLFEKKFK